MSSVTFITDRLEDHVDHMYDKIPQIRANREIVSEVQKRSIAGTLTAALVAGVEAHHKQVLTDLFKDSDEDGGGVLDRDEIKRLAYALGTKLSEEDLDSALSQMDSDGSGEVRLLPSNMLLPRRSRAI